MYSLANNGRRNENDRIKLPILKPIQSTFPSRDERIQLQDIAEQSCRYLKRIAYSIATIKHEWDLISTESNMELYQIKEKHGDSLVNMCGTTGIYATLNQIAQAVALTNVLIDTNHGPKTFLNEILATQDLLRIDYKTSIKWMAVRGNDSLPHRDFVVLHSMERFEDVETKGLVISFHSVDFPGAPQSYENSNDSYRFVRGGMYRSGIILLENHATPGILDVVSIFKVDFKGSDRQTKLYRSTMTSWLGWMGHLNQHFLCEKLNKVGAPRLRRPQTSSSTSKTRACESCEAPFNFYFRRNPKKSQCMMCSAVICTACTVKYHDTTKSSMVFCIPCLVKWNPDGPSIKFIQPTHLLPPSPISQIKLRSQIHKRFAPTNTCVTNSGSSSDTNIPILGDEQDISTPPTPLFVLSDVDLSRLDHLVHIQPSKQAKSHWDDPADDDESDPTRQTAVFHDSEPRLSDLVLKLGLLRRELNSIMLNIVRESSRGHTKEAKAALDRRSALKRQVKEIQDILGAAKQEFTDTTSPRWKGKAQIKESLREDLQTTQFELQAIRSSQDSDAFSRDTIDRLNPNDIAALQAKMDGLLTTPSSFSDPPLQTLWLSSDHQYSEPVEKNLSAESIPQSLDEVRFSDIQIFTASNKRVDVRDLHFVDDIHSFAL